MRAKFFLILIFFTSTCPFFEAFADSTSPSSKTTSPSEISWQEAETLILAGKVKAAGQNHSREVHLYLDEGVQTGHFLKTTEPELDKLYEVVKRCGEKCRGLESAIETE